MDAFFTLIKKSLVATMFVTFGLMETYVPIPHTNNVNQAEAQWAVFDASNAIKQGLDYVQQKLIEGWNWAIANKEMFLDGIAWKATKMVVAGMLDSIRAWARNGFEGRPMFVEDIEGFLRESADRAFGEYIQELGSVGSFLCDPFKLDFQIALTALYARDRINQPVTCTLTGIIDNLDGFLSGTRGSFAQGGWNDWFDITADPMTYTPVGALVTADQVAQARIVNARGVVAKELDYGNSWLSQKDCETVEEGGVEKTFCSIISPGKTLQEAVTFNIDGERQALITADEFNEAVVEIGGALATKIFADNGGLLR